MLDQLSNFSIVEADRLKSVLQSLKHHEHVHSFAESQTLPALVTRYFSENEATTINDQLASGDVAITSAFDSLDMIDCSKDFRAWQSKFKVLKSAVNAHNSFEQDKIFPVLREKMSIQEKEKLVKDVGHARQNVPSASITGAILDGAKGLLGSVGSLFSRATGGVHH